MNGPLRVGVGGPVGSGKTALLLSLCRAMRDTYNIAVVTNDIYTREDAEFLTRHAALSQDRILGVETGGCPHTAIREDASINLDAVEQMAKRHQPEVIFIESGGDNLSATFSPELVDAYIYVIDVAEGDKIPRKGGPAIRTSDLLLINKTELAPYVGADLDVMARDAAKQRGPRPFLFADLKSEKGKDDLLAWRHQVHLLVELPRLRDGAQLGLVDAGSLDLRVGGKARDPFPDDHHPLFGIGLQERVAGTEQAMLAEVVVEV